MDFFDRVYLGSPPWEIGQPQPEFVRLESEGEIVGRVLDVGCGTGENALHFAAAGHPTWGVDFAPNAVRRAQAKSRERGLRVEFHVASALELESLGERFDTITDCGLFHTLGDSDRPVYSKSLRAALKPRGRFFVLCFSEDEPTDWGGPRRVSREELHSTFADGWDVRYIRKARFQTTFRDVEGKAWLAAVGRT
jgi:cyclopropane fatty-acyl-phospholipid synthase-like methyltransferase